MVVVVVLIVGGGDGAAETFGGDGFLYLADRVVDVGELVELGGASSSPLQEQAKELVKGILADEGQ